MTLKELVYKILLEEPETRDSDKKLIWSVWKRSGLIDDGGYDGIIGAISIDDFMKAPSPESIRRVRQQLQRSDLLTGTKLIQPTKEIKQKRVKLSKEKGYSFMQGKQPVFNPLTQTYEY